MKNFLKLNVSNLLDIVIIAFICLILFSGSSVISNYIYIIVILMTCCVFLSCLIKGKGKIKILSKSLHNIWFILIIILFCGKLLFSYNIKHSYIYILMFVSFFIISILFQRDKNFFEKLINAVLGCSIILAVSILLSIVIPNFMENYFSFLMPTNQGSIEIMRGELKQGIYSGLAFERAYAAAELTLGICVIYSKIINEKKIKNSQLFILILLFVALFSTGKRMLLLVNVFNLIVIFLLNMKKENVRKFLKVSIPLIFALIIILMKFESVGKVFERLTDKNSANTMQLRNSYYWVYCFDMFENKPLTGYGINTFVDYLSNNSSNEIIYNAHNIYIQLLGECGVIGLLVFIILFLTILYESVKTLIFYRKMKYDTKLINFSILLQLVFLIYGLSGNTLYYYCQLLFYFVAVWILNNLKVYGSEKFE